MTLEYQELLRIEQDLEKLSDHDVQRQILHCLREMYRLMRLQAITSATLGLQSDERPALQQHERFLAEKKSKAETKFTKREG